MNENKKGSAGGKVMAERLRKEAINNYYNNPNYCLNCNLVIEVLNNQKVCDVKIKKFCNRKCSASYFNKLKPKRIKKEKIKKERKSNSNKSKEYFKQKYNNWFLSRIPIAKNAKLVYSKSNKPKECKICGYNKHIEICHIKPVSEFHDTSTLKEINDINNLVALCRNHHWEFDNGYITI